MKAPIKPVVKRLEICCILAPAIFVLLCWTLVMSSNFSYLKTMGLTRLLIFAGLLSFCIAYLIVLFIAALREHPDSVK